MSKEETTIVVNLPKALGLLPEELAILKKKFRADVIDLLKKKGEPDKVIVDEITQIILPPKPK